MAIARRRELADERTDVDLLGVKNSVNKVFTTPEKFFHSTLRSIRLHLNGQRLHEGGNGVGDYLPSESGGLGTGYDTITFNSLCPAPRATDLLTADYFTV